MSATIIQLDAHRDPPPKEGPYSELTGLYSELTEMLLNLAAMLRDDGGDDGDGLPLPEDGVDVAV